jgi:long-subunit fatty acid transport protein
MVFVFANTDVNSPVNKITFGINYDRTFNHDARFSAFGQTTSTIGDYFVQRGEGISVDNFTPGNQDFSTIYRNLGQDFGFAAQEAYLAYETFLIDPAAQSNSNYISNTNSAAFNNDMITRESGLNGQLSFNLGTQLLKKLYLGMNMNFHFVDYDRFSSYLETNDGPGDIREVYYENNLRTRGSGFSLQFGAIYKPVEQVRLGLAYQTPTWFRIEDEISQGLETFSESQNDFISGFPDVIILFPSYNFRVPGKATLSFAYIFGANGLLSMDYSYQDFSNQEFTSRGFGDLNNEIRTVFQATNNLNVGGEYRIGKASLRGGYHYAESPYADGFVIGDTNGFSLGLGYNFGGTTVDLAYRRTYLERNDDFVQTGLQERAFVENTINNIMLSLTFRL